MMKHVLNFSTIVLTLVFLGCSSDDGPATPPDEMEMPTTLSLPINIVINNVDLGETTELEIIYDDQNRPETINFTNGSGILQTQTSIVYNEMGLISIIGERELDPSPFSTTFNFIYAGDLLTTINTQIDDSAFFNILPVTFEESTNTYTVSDGGDQVYVFDDDNNLVSYTASGLPIWNIEHDPSENGLFSNVENQVPLGIVLPTMGLDTALSLYLFSTRQVNSYSFGTADSESLNTLRDADGLITGVEASFMGTTFLTTEITYETIVIEE